ncbi:reduced folate transporter [Megalops cyprinoides]|uniref:reduced folate transporter n=1 Tax=Megalops cyprinoides TaxID=118141 RepID=UPI0018655699|nr:reduced folate transporter [Megalops cyprinoides]XP_036396869.1 reduced folate transporter [Megalops cyprinoides]XP_036396870.1 reduced folate transporter [Megalops cyprinoides]
MVDTMAAGDDVKQDKEALKEAGKPEDTEKAAAAAGGKEPGAWQWSIILLCFYGFVVQLKPGEPFITPFLLSSKNFTRTQVTNEVTPVLSYSHMAVLVPVFLLTDFLRYKPMLVLQSLSNMSIWLLLLLGSTLLEMQFMEFFYGISMATRVAYSSYIFSLVKPELYQRVASYSRSAVLLGVFTSSVLGQLLFSKGGLSYATLSAISLGLVSFGLLLSLCLPWPKRSMFFNQEARDKAREEAATDAELSKMKADGTPAPPAPPKPRSSWRNSVFFHMLKELRTVPQVPSLRLWSMWWVFNSTCYYLVVFYVHILWDKVFPAVENKVYNGAVEAASTLLGAFTSFIAGFVKIRWSLWSELVIGVNTALQAGLLLLMGTTSSIWVCYVAYSFFRGFYQFLVPIATFQIASSLSKEMCALVFGVNTFLGTILKTIITIIVADKRGLALSVHAQFMVYFFLFTLLTVTYLGCAAWVIVRHYRSREGGRATEEATPTELSPMDRDPCETDSLANGISVKA